MIKLLKYDWKRNASPVMGIIAVLLIIQISITTVGTMRNWEIGVMLVLSMLAYSAVSMTLFVMVCRTFDQNIKAYNRRLLPVRPINSIFSSLIQSFISLLGVMLLVAVHLWIYVNMEDGDRFIVWGGLTTEGMVATGLAAVWKFTFIIIVIFFCITVSRAVRVKGNIWIGIILFFVITNATSWLESKLDMAGNIWVSPMFTVYIKEGGSTASVMNDTIQIPWMPVVLELLLAAGFIYGMVKLIDRKIEV
ncbi:hypothetical protein [Paenibacillus sp. DMB20]|uniref:hypothetical protein n=1 Tax=Paenibacillus sp. DMB20 TaxID=1642570 RepID=UPI00062790A5|nr:hypothetical protein [Paenibacillus sp. DMB20]KKO51375.1 hypothetical protein XI25_26245 [Paenibacillus sp. DMB20]